MPRNKKIKSTNKLYKIFVALRILLVFVPQTGYIHPDEFFQTVEVLASRIFQFEASLPWEFNVTTPIRSIGVPYITIGLSYQILKTVNTFTSEIFNTSLVTPYAILIIPRIFLCLCSFLMDYCLMKICEKNNEKSSSRLIVLSTSYVTLIYCTRTFSNTLEVILFTLLLYFVSESMIFSNIIVRQREYLNKRYENTNNPAERARFHKLRLFIASHSYRNCLQISTICVMGVFNRPTFLCFAILPVFFWLYRGIGYRSVKPLEFNLRIFALIFSSIPTIFALVVADSFFYGYISWGEIGMFDISIDSFTFPPLNFIKYNIDSSNLAKHGLHPRYTNLLVNVPLLFNVLGIIAIFGVADLFVKFFRKQYNLLPTVRSIKGLMITSIIAPTFLLSLFPHQEPRFLIPLILPLVYLYAQDIRREETHELVHVPKASVAINAENTANNRKETNGGKSSVIFKTWLSVNIFFAIFYGFVHQGGIYPAANHLSNEIDNRAQMNYHIFTSHIYSIPHVFFKLPDSHRLFSFKNTKFTVDKFVFTYEEGSADLKLLIERMLSTLRMASGHRKRYRMYLLLTGTKHEEFLFHNRVFSGVGNNNNVSGDVLNVKYLASFYPHLSTEALPDFTEILQVLSATSVRDLQFSQVVGSFTRLFSSFVLKLYEINLNNTH